MVKLFQRAPLCAASLHEAGAPLVPHSCVHETGAPQGGLLLGPLPCLCEVGAAPGLCLSPETKETYAWGLLSHPQGMGLSLQFCKLR